MQRGRAWPGPASCVLGCASPGCTLSVLSISDCQGPLLQHPGGTGGERQTPRPPGPLRRQPSVVFSSKALTSSALKVVARLLIELTRRVPPLPARRNTNHASAGSPRTPASQLLGQRSSAPASLPKAPAREGRWAPGRPDSTPLPQGLVQSTRPGSGHCSFTRAALAEGAAGPNAPADRGQKPLWPGRGAASGSGLYGGRR